MRYFSRLLPLLLEWLHASDVDTCLLAARVRLHRPEHACMLVMLLCIYKRYGRYKLFVLPDAYILAWEQRIALKEEHVMIEKLAHGLLAWLQALTLVLRHTWPRMPAHAQLVWDHLAEEYGTTAASIPQLDHSRDECKDSTSEHHKRSQTSEDGIGKTGRLNGNGSESTEEVLEEIVRAAEVIWRAGGEAFQEHEQQKAPENMSALLQRIMSVQSC